MGQSHVGAGEPIKDLVGTHNANLKDLLLRSLMARLHNFHAWGSHLHTVRWHEAACQPGGCSQGHGWHPGTLAPLFYPRLSSLTSAPRCVFPSPSLSHCRAANPQLFASATRVRKNHRPCPYRLQCHVWWTRTPAAQMHAGHIVSGDAGSHMGLKKRLPERGPERKDLTVFWRKPVLQKNIHGISWFLP